MVTDTAEPSLRRCGSSWMVHLPVVVVPTSWALPNSRSEAANSSALEAVWLFTSTTIGRSTMFSSDSPMLSWVPSL